MISIVGTRIYMYEGDDCALIVKYRDSSDNVQNFSTTDTLTLTIRDINARKVIMVKLAESYKVEDQEVSMFIFTSQEALTLKKGDYKYEIILDTSTGSRHTLIDKANFNILENLSTAAYAELDGDFIPHRLETVDANVLYLNAATLVCKFDYIKLEKMEIPGTLIDFDRVYDIKNEEGEDDGEDDSLILFGDLKTPEEDEDGTLITF